MAQDNEHDMENPYEPHMAKVVEIREEAPGERAVKTFKVEFLDEDVKDQFAQRSGQCAMLGLLGRGESFISISSPPTWKGFLEFSVLQYVTGRVTPERLRTHSALSSNSWIKCWCNFSGSGPGDDGRRGNFGSQVLFFSQNFHLMARLPFGAAPVAVIEPSDPLGTRKK